MCIYICILRVQYTYICIYTRFPIQYVIQIVCVDTQFLAFSLCTHFRCAYYNFTVNSIWPRCFSFFCFFLKCSSFFCSSLLRGNLIARSFSSTFLVVQVESSVVQTKTTSRETTTINC